MVEIKNNVAFVFSKPTRVCRLGKGRTANGNLVAKLLCGAKTRKETFLQNSSNDKLAKIEGQFNRLWLPKTFSVRV